MTRLDDAFGHLADRGAPRGPDHVLDAARDRAAALRRRRLVAMGGVAAAAVVLLAAVGLATIGGDSSTQVESGRAATTAPSPTPGSAPTSAPVASSSTTAPTEPTSPPAEGATVQVFFSTGTGEDCTATRASERPVEGPAVLRAALDHLLRGPTQEEQDSGLSSWFSEATAGGVRSVDIVDGVALVDLRGDLPELIPGASTSCGSAALLAQLDATVTQFDAVDRSLYSLDGDAAAFYGWLQGSAPDGSSSTPEADGVPAWPGTVDHLPGGTLEVGDIDSHLAAVDPEGRLPVDDVVSLLLHLEDERARGTAVLVEHLPDDGDRRVAVTLTNLGDDSIAQVRYEVQVGWQPGAPPTIGEAAWAQRCHPGRGHQDLRPELCV